MTSDDGFARVLCLSDLDEEIDRTQEHLDSLKWQQRCKWEQLAKHFGKGDAMVKKLDLRTIPQLTSRGGYRIHVSWDYLEEHISHGDGIDFNPDFQRGHVWTTAQQSAYLEFCLKGGNSSRELLFNCPGWMGNFRGPYEIVDGLQRITAVRKFLRGELLVFKRTLQDFDGYRRKDGTLRLVDQNFSWCVNNLETRAEVLKWYLEINIGGTPHTRKELTRVQKLLDEEEGV